MQVIGLCRFSYSAEGGFQVRHETNAERAAYLYAPARMKARLASFETMTLPALRAQSDPDFTLLILTGEDLPEPYLDRLLTLTEDMPQAVIIQRPPGPHRAVCRDVMTGARHDYASPCIQFRMDDDDAVAVDFVARLRADAAMVAPLCEASPSVILDYRRGLIIRPTAQGPMGKEVELAYYPMAMGMVIAGRSGRSIMNFAHSKVAGFMPTVTFSDSLMFVRGHDDFNDSRQGASIKPMDLPLMDKAAEALLYERFAIRADHIRQCFAE